MKVELRKRCHESLLQYQLQALTRKEEGDVGQHREHSRWHSNMSIPMSKSLSKSWTDH